MYSTVTHITIYNFLLGGQLLLGGRPSPPLVTALASTVTWNELYTKIIFYNKILNFVKELITQLMQIELNLTVS